MVLALHFFIASLAQFNNGILLVTGAKIFTNIADNMSDTRMFPYVLYKEKKERRKKIFLCIFPFCCF